MFGRDARLLRAIGRAQSARLDLVLTVFLGLLAGLMLVGQAHLLSRAIDRAFLGEQPLARLWPLLAGLAGLATLRAGLVWAGEMTANRAATRVKAEMQTKLAAHLAALGPIALRGERTGELATTASTGVEALDEYIRHYVPQLALAVLVPAALLAFILPIDWVSGLILLLTAPLLPVFMILIGHQAQALTRRRWTMLSRLSAHFLDALQGLAALKLLGRSRDHSQIIARIGERYRQATMGVLRVTFLSALILEMIAAISTAVVAVGIALRLLAGQMAFEPALFVLILAPEFYLPLRMLGARFHAGMAGAAAAQRIFEVLDMPVGQDPTASAGEREPRAAPLRFENVCYTYPGADRPAVDGLSFEIAEGETVALVGPSGAGKSTVAALLLRFAEPAAGRIVIDGRSLASVPAEMWRQQVAWVSQTPYLFYGTAAENIRLARPEASDDEVVWAARQAQAHDLIEALPEGYQTVIGEQGARLSGGEAQRIALARAVLKNAPLVILDEATAHLDPETADAVSAATERLLRDRTALVIAHRLETVRRADRILVIDGGRMVESGTHAALLAQGGLYARLVGAAQNSYHQGHKGHEGNRPGGREILRDAQNDGPTGEMLREAQKDGSSLGPEQRQGQRAWAGRFLGAPFAGWMALATLLGLATIASSVGLMATSASLIAHAALRPPIAELSVAIVAVRLFGIARGVFRYAERIVSHEVTFRLLARLRTWFYAAIEPLAPARLMAYRSGDLLARVVADVETLDNLYLRAIAPPAVAVLAVGGAVLLLARADVRLGGALLVFLVLAGVGVPLLAWWVGRRPGQDLVRVRAALHAALVDGVQGLPELLIFGQARRHLAHIGGLRSELAGSQTRMAYITGLHQGAMGLLSGLAVAATVALAVPLIGQGRFEGVALASLALGALASFEAVAPLPQALQYVENGLEAARRLRAVVDAPPPVADPPVPHPVPAGCGLSVQEVRFSYQAGEPAVLDGVSLELRPGQTLALVGPSGAGKSTLVHLLARFWDYDQGRIVLGGHELHDYDQDTVRRSMAVVTQRPHLFNATIRDNLRLARPDATEAELVAAARQAHLHDWIASLPESYETWIGEQGLRLSAGQRQRLAIARAVLQDAPLLILDEPTANLDALAEREVLAALGRLTSRDSAHATLLITHRLAGLEAADEIVVLDRGRVAERGRHETLLAQGGVYYRMWMLQNEAVL